MSSDTPDTPPTRTMTDILTQLQTSYDRLLTQFFSTISYLSQRHPLIAPDPDPADPFTNPPSTTVSAQTPGAADQPQSATGLLPGAEDVDRAPYSLHPIPPAKFEEMQRLLAEDLVHKGQDIEFLISKLPGLGKGEDEQARETEILVQRVREMERRRKQKRKEMRAVVRRLEDVIGGMATSVDYGQSNGIHGHG